MSSASRTTAAIFIDPRELLSTYDRGRLVPFTGPGLSVPACASWQQFVSRLEKSIRKLGVEQPSPGAGSLAERARAAIGTLQRHGQQLPDAVRSALYTSVTGGLPTNTLALARIRWPLVCTTNHDELHLRAAMQLARQAGRAGGAKCSIRVLGRSDPDCKALLQHLALPEDQVLWALNGLLRPTDAGVQDIAYDPDWLPERLEGELVVDPSEYDQAMQRTPFRRSFAELYRSRSLLFLGSDLSESCFRTLFDDIVERGGVPRHLHHAFVEEGTLDADFMRRRYRIICYTYPQGQHQVIGQWLSEFDDALRATRSRVNCWSYSVGSGGNVSHDIGLNNPFTFALGNTPSKGFGWVSSVTTADDVSHGIRRNGPTADFEVVHALIPRPRALPNDEAVAFSCKRSQTANSEPRGRADISQQGRNAVGNGRWNQMPKYEWVDSAGFVVCYTQTPNAFGIVACETAEPEPQLRPQDSIRGALIAFLDETHQREYRTVHVELLFDTCSPRISLIEIARAYGQWRRSRPATSISVKLYVISPGVLTLLRGGFLKLTEDLDGRAAPR